MPFQQCSGYCCFMLSVALLYALTSALPAALLAPTTLSPVPVSAYMLAVPPLLYTSKPDSSRDTLGA